MIVATHTLPSDVRASLEEVGVEVTSLGEGAAPTHEALIEGVRGATALLSLVNDNVDRDVVRAAGPSLRVVANVAVGYDNLDLAALAENGTAATHTPGVLTEATADFTMALLLALVRRVAEGDRLVRAGRPWTFGLDFMTGLGLQGKTLGIVGYGAIGREVAVRAQAFGMEVRHTTVQSTPEETQHLLAASDIVTLHCPYTEDTHHLLDAEAIARMKPGAYLVNTARGPIVAERALADALEAGHLAGAALDVFEHEPEISDRLTRRDDVVLTPHLGSATTETRHRMAALAADNVVAVLSGRPPLNPVPATMGRGTR